MATVRAAPYGALDPSSRFSAMRAPTASIHPPNARQHSHVAGVMVLSSEPCFQGLKSEWNRLTQDISSSHLFDLPEWVRLPGNIREDLTLWGAVACRSDKELVGLLPLVQRGSAWRLISATIIGGTATELAPRTEIVHRPSQRDEVARASWFALRQQPAWNVLELWNVPKDGAADLLGECAKRDGYRVKTVPGLSTPFLDLPPNHDAELPVESRAYRISLEIKLRRLAAMGELHLRSYQTVCESLPRFVELETGHPLCSKHYTRRALRARLRFYEEAAGWAERRGCLRIFSLELDGKPLSMVYGIAWAGTFYALRVAHDRHLQMYSPGQLAVMRTLQNLPEDGITRCEFVGPMTPWKEVWTTTSRTHLCHLIFRPNARGKTLLAPAFALQKRGEAVWEGIRALFASVLS